MIIKLVMNTFYIENEILRPYFKYLETMEGKKVLRINDNKSISLLLFEFVHRYWSVLF